MINTSQLIIWLNRHSDQNIWIDEGGLALESECGDSLEIGGAPEEGNEEKNKLEASNSNSFSDNGLG